MKRRGFLAALGALPFVGRWIQGPPFASSVSPICILAASTSGSMTIEWTRDDDNWSVEGDYAFAVGDREIRAEPLIKTAGLEAWLPDPSDPYWTGALDRYPKLS